MGAQRFLDNLFRDAPQTGGAAAFMRNLPRTKEDAYRNSPQGRDEVDGVTGMDATSRKLVGAAQRLGGDDLGDAARAVIQAPATVARGFAGGAVGANAGLNRLLNDVTFNSLGTGYLGRLADAGGEDAARLQAGATANYKTTIGNDVGQGLNSFGASAPLVVGALATKNPAIMYGGMGAQTGLTEYDNARVAGLNVAKALPYAAGQAAIEVGTEAMPAGALVDAFKTANPVMNLIKNPLRYAVGEGLGEQVATHGQDLMQGAFMDAPTNPEWLNVYQANRADAARQTAIASLIMGPGNVGLGATTQAAKDVVDSFRQPQRAVNPVGVQAQQADTATEQPLTPEQQQELRREREAQRAQAMAMPVDPGAIRATMAAMAAARDNGGMRTRTDVPTPAQVAGKDAMAQTLAMLRQHEGFSAGTYWDVNAFRLGYGTDTITDANGRVRRVQRGDKVSKADAERDLARRAQAFREGARNTIGAAAFDRLPANAQAALTSVAYNYGSLDKLKTVVNAARSGDLQQLADAIAARGVDNNGVNAKRRQAEAAAVLGGAQVAAPAAGGRMRADVDHTQPEYAADEGQDAMADAADALTQAQQDVAAQAEGMRRAGEQQAADAQEVARRQRIDALMEDEQAPAVEATAVPPVQQQAETPADAPQNAQPDMSEVWDALPDEDVRQALVRAGYGGEAGNLTEAGAALADSGWDYLPEAARGKLAQVLPADGAYVRDLQEAVDKPARQGVAVDDGQTFSRSAMKDTDTNIRRGRDAMNKALLDKSDVKRAMYRNDIGWVDFVWGAEGKADAQGRTKGAMGLSHIIEARQRKDGMSRDAAVKMLTQDMVETIACGGVYKHVVSPNGKAERLQLRHNGYEANMVKNAGNNAWLLTGYELYQSGADGVGFDTSAATHNRPTPARSAMGAPDTGNTVRQQEHGVNKKGDGVSETLRQQQRDKAAAIRTELDRVLGDKAKLVQVVDVINQRPDDAMSLITSGVEGWFDGATGRIALVAETLKPERAAWVAWHELGHRGVALSHFADYTALMRQADRNATVRALADAIRNERQHYANRDFKDPVLRKRAVAVEEALVELYAAQKTGDYAALEKRYGVTVPAAAKAGMAGYVQRVAQRLRAVLAKVLGRPGNTFSDADVWALLKDVAHNSGQDAGSLKGDERFSRSETEDAEFARKAALLQGEPVYTISERKAPKEIKALRDWATALFERAGGRAVNPEIGEVVLNARSVKDSMAHGMNADKAMAFEAVPSVLEQGVVVADTKHEGMASYYISAPVEIEGRADIVTALVRKDVNTSRFYLHSVTTKENLLNAAPIESAADTGVSEPRGKLHPRDIASVLRNYLNYKGGDDAMRFSRSRVADTPDARADKRWRQQNQQEARRSREQEKRQAHAERMRPEPVQKDWKDEGISAKDLDMKGKAWDSRNWLSMNARGEWKAGRWFYDNTIRKLDGLLKALGLQHKMSSDFTEIRHDYKGFLNKQAFHLRRIGEAFTQFSDQHLSLLSDIIERELTPAQMKAVQPELLELAEAMREMMNAQADEMVALKMLSPQARDKWRDVYLPRMYSRHIKDMKNMGLDKLQRALVNSSGAVRGIKGDNLKGRGLYENGVARADIAEWEKQGFEVVKDDGDTVTMWRDWTREERESWGEIRDAGLRFATGFINTSRDIAQGRMFAQVAMSTELASKHAKAGWVQVPTTTIPDTGGVLRYGALAGMYVHPEVLDNLQYQFDVKGLADQIWRSYVGYWKMTKTVYNPVAHMNNTVSNVVMLHLAGGNITDLKEPIAQMWQEFRQPGSSAVMMEMRELGLIGEAIDPRGMRDMFHNVDLNDSASKHKVLAGFIAASQDRIQKAGAQITRLQEASGLDSDKRARLAKIANIKKHMEDAYRIEDEVFKAAVYLRGRKHGLSPREARNYALDYFFDYGDVPKTVRFLRDRAGLPFLTYPTKAIPALLRAAITRPHRFGLFAGLLYGLNWMAYAMLGGDADEEEERRLMPDYLKGFSPFGLKTIRLTNDENGNPQFLDLVRFLPMGDLFDFDNQNGGVAIPQWATPGGPVLGNAAAWIWNKDLFTGRDFVPSYYSDERKLWERMKYTIGDHVPAGYHITRILNGLRNQVDDDAALAKVMDSMDITGRNRYGEFQSLKQALVGATGVKVRRFEMREQKQRHDAKLKRELSNRDSGYRRMMRDKSMSDAAKRKETERYRSDRKTIMNRLYDKQDDD